ncbi:hypothetical protein [Thalassotalea agariperforans]
MHRIDAAFAHPLNEKNDPKERFVQALDEFDIQGDLRILLIKHFSDNWQNIFRRGEKLEGSLSNLGQFSSEQEKCVGFYVDLLKRDLFDDDLTFFFRMQKKKKSPQMEFLDDVIQQFFPDSPFGLFEAGIKNKVNDYYVMVLWLYGADYHYSQAFFDDEALNKLEPQKRQTVLWNYLYAVAPELKYLEGTELFRELQSIAKVHLITGPLTKKSSNIIRGIEFIKAWIKSDAKAGKMLLSSNDFLYDVSSPWYKIQSAIGFEREENSEVSELLNEWLKDTKLNIEKLLYVNTDLTLASKDDSEQWAKGLDSYFLSYCNDKIYKSYDYSELNHEKLNKELKSAHQELCLELTREQLIAWVGYSINSDFQSVLNSKSRTFNFSQCQEKWINKEHYELWESVFLEQLNVSSIEQKLSILSCHPPYTEDCYKGYFEWWNELFINLVLSEGFPKELTPDWTIVAIDRIELEKVALYVDKSIGIIRGELSKSNDTEKVEHHHQNLEKLLSFFDKSSAKKAIRHRLLLLRSSNEPYADESISKIGSLFNREGHCRWYDSLVELSKTQFAYQTNGNRGVTQENFQQVQSDFYVNFSHELVEFCLSRLRLRKSEKAKDGKYDSSQVVEQSSIWRQGYLKALKELGFDLNGKVHKTVNFTKKSDPSEDVRSIASECYKAVRRHAKKSPSIQDLKRGIIAAEWWLLLCQRQELLGPESVDYEAALKTRRNLMRNP